ncbi:MAG: molybdopterin-guanine dinucleotide biosynthesis protein B [Nitrospirae bacterium GWC2_57_9]|nr:MAG: molybdopterin-guanine dinucleotide biosynthesis protein B [Nitrospirae bacterium GWC2_57_9]
MLNKKTTPVVSFVAAGSNSGKTTLIEKVVKALKGRGLRVAVIKHASKGFDLDQPGKDSWRFRQAGADAVVLVGPGETAIIETTDREPSPEELEGRVNADIVIHEGFKKSARNKIEVFRAGISADRPLCLDDRTFSALVSDKQFDVPVPFFDLNDATGVAEFIVKKFVQKS